MDPEEEEGLWSLGFTFSVSSSAIAIGITCGEEEVEETRVPRPKLDRRLDRGLNEADFERKTGGLSSGMSTKRGSLCSPLAKML